MKSNLTIREKSTLLTILASFVPSILIMFLGALKTKYIISFLGSEQNGIYQLLIHLSSFVVFGNLGLGSLFKIAYYRSISSGDKNKTTEIYNYSNQFFKKTTIITIVISVIISIFALFFIDSQIPRIQVVLLQFLVCAPNIINFYIGKDITLLCARQKEYVYLIMYNFSYIIRLIISLIIIRNTSNIFVFLSVDMILTSLSYIIIEIIIKKDNNIELCNTDNIDSTPMRFSKYLIPNKISKIIFSNIDTLLISKMVSNTFVSIYTSYIFIANCLVSLEGYVINSFMNSLGNLFHSEDTYKKSVAQEVIVLSTFIFIVICVPLTIGMKSFVSKIWINNSEYLLDNITYIFLCFYYLLYSLRLLSGLFEDSIGSYKDTYLINIVQSIGNVALSIILCKLIGISGIILATLIILLPFEILKINISLKTVKIDINRKYLFIFIILSFIEVLISIYIMKNIIINNIISWIICMFIVTLISLLINFFIYIVIYKDFRNVVFELKRKLLK